MKDVLFYFLMYNIWNTEFYNQHPTMIAIVLTLYIVINIIEFIDAFNQK